MHLKKERHNKQEERLNHMLKQKETKRVVGSHHTNGGGEKKRCEVGCGTWFNYF
jgi:ABC-type lipopolysaccharide export system ATPase subunit